MVLEREVKFFEAIIFSAETKIQRQVTPHKKRRWYVPAILAAIARFVFAITSVLSLPLSLCHFQSSTHPFNTSYPPIPPLPFEFSISSQTIFTVSFLLLENNKNGKKHLSNTPETRSLFAEQKWFERKERWALRMDRDGLFESA